MTLLSDHPLALAVVAAIRTGDLQALQRLLDENAGLARARIVDGSCITAEASRTLLHIASDWPGHFPNCVAIIAALTAAGAEVDAPFTGRHAETALHWAASSDNVMVLDSLLDAGADIEAPGAVIGNGTPLADAVAFGKWQTARRLVERGAQTTLWQAAALGMLERVEDYFAGDASRALPRWSLRPATSDTAPPDEVTHAFWCACHGGQRRTAEYLLGRNADLNWIGYDGLTPVDAARRSGASELAEWLCSLGAKTAEEMR